MRRNYWKRIGLLVSIMIVVSLLLAACGGDDDSPTATPSGSAPTATSGSAPEPTATTGGGNLSGEINIDGSSTVYPVSQAMAEEFNAINRDVRMSVGFSGTGGGFKKFCAGETHISNASRPMKSEEIELCKAAGIEFVELAIAIDGLSVVVNPANDWADCLTLAQLSAIWAPGSTVSNWNQVDPSFPDEKLVLYGPGTDSGTFDYFTEAVNGETGASRADFTASEDDNVLVQGVMGDKGALGYFGYAYYIENQGNVRALAIDGGEGCVEPNEETVRTGEYQPLSRPLYFYVSVAALNDPVVEAFIRFCLTDGLVVIPEVGYVAFPDEKYQDDLALIDAALSGDSSSQPKPTATTAAAEPTATERMGKLEGEINIDGSSTVFPVTQAVAEEFNALHSDVQISVGFSGTGGGFKKFCAGETQISNASRPISAPETELCNAAGVEYVELAVAIDGLSVVVNPENDWVDCLTLEQLAAIWGPESTINNWNQIDPSFPDQKLVLYGPGTDSGTFDYFTDVVNGEEGASRADYTASEDDNVLVLGVEGDKGALGYFGYAYYIENKDRLKIVGIDGGAGCVVPDDETVASGEYAPLSRPLFIYVATASLADPAVLEFVRFYLTEGPTLVSEVGYVAYDDAKYAEDWAAVEAAMP